MRGQVVNFNDSCRLSSTGMWRGLVW